VDQRESPGGSSVSGNDPGGRGTNAVDQTESPAGRRARTVRIELSPTSLLSIVAVAIGVWVLVQIWQVILVIVIAAILAGTFSPVVDGLERHRVRRPIALGTVLVLLVGAVIGLGFLVIPALGMQVGSLIDAAPAMQMRLAGFLARFPPLARQAQTVRDATPDRYLEPVGRYALDYAQAAVEIVVLGLTTVVLAFYMIADRERVTGFFFALIPRRYHLRLARILLQLETVVGGYVRGQALTSLFIGLFVFVLLAVLRVPNALALAIFAAFTDLIPFIGGVLAITPAVLSALSRGVGVAVVVLVAIALYQEFESRVIVPRVYGLTMRLSSVAVMVALLVGGKLLGIVGAFLALPIAAGIRVIVEELRIDLPGEQPGEQAERSEAARSEAFFAREAAGASAVESAVMATELATQLQEEEQAETGRVEQPPEEEGGHTAAPAVAGHPGERGEREGRPAP
jgi:predicted PurR-regulated permease PerM